MATKVAANATAAVPMLERCEAARDLPLATAVCERRRGAEGRGTTACGGGCDLVAGVTMPAATAIADEKGEGGRRCYGRLGRLLSDSQGGRTEEREGKEEGRDYSGFAPELGHHTQKLGLHALSLHGRKTTSGGYKFSFILFIPQN